MAGQFDNNLLVSYHTFNGMAPHDGPRALLVDLDFTAKTSYAINLEQAKELNRVDILQCVYVDNSGNNQALTLTMRATQQTIIFPAGCQGYMPVLSSVPHFTASLPTAGTNVSTKIQFLTMPMPSGMWVANPANAIAALTNVNLSQVAGVATATGHGTAAGALRVELPTDGTGVVGLNAGTNLIGGIELYDGAGVNKASINSDGTQNIRSVPGGGAAPTIKSAALETGHVVKATPGSLIDAVITTTTVAGFVLVFDSITVPAAGAVTPIWAAAVGANGTVSLDFSRYPLVCAVGISLAFSLAVTPFTKTDSATAFFSARAI